MPTNVLTSTSGAPRPIRVLAIPGSLRRRSYNRALLAAATQLAPAGMSITVYDGLETIPLFNEDLEDAPHDQPGVVRLRHALSGSDGLIVATPEYNQSVPGVLKNTIDWLSRSRPGEGLVGRPVAVTGATTGPWGTRLAQTSLRQTLLATGAIVLPQPALYVRRAESLFDGDGALVDAGTRTHLRHLLLSFSEWIHLVSPELSASAAV